MLKNAYILIATFLKESVFSEFIFVTWLHVYYVSQWFCDDYSKNRILQFFSGIDVIVLTFWLNHDFVLLYYTTDKDPKTINNFFQIFPYYM